MLTEENVRNALKIYVPPNRNAGIGLDEDLSSLGLDSLDLFNILLELSEITKTEVPDEDVDQLKTINSILQYFNSKNS